MLLENLTALLVLAPTHEKGGVPASCGEVLSFAKTKALCTRALETSLHFSFHIYSHRYINRQIRGPSTLAQAGLSCRARGPKESSLRYPRPGLALQMPSVSTEAASRPVEWRGGVPLLRMRSSRKPSRDTETTRYLGDRGLTCSKALWVPALSIGGTEHSQLPCRCHFRWCWRIGRSLFIEQAQYFVLVLRGRGLKQRALCILGKCSITELHPFLEFYETGQFHCVAQASLKLASLLLFPRDGNGLQMCVTIGLLGELQGTL